MIKYLFGGIAIVAILLSEINFTYLLSENQTIEEADWQVWEKLFQITWDTKYNATLDAEIEYPIFSEDVKALEGKEISITGFIVPVSMYAGDGTFIILSAYPAKSCFFCGRAGPETVIEIHLDQHRSYFGDDKIAFKGKLRLNADDIDHLIYILEDAVQSYE